MWERRNTTVVPLRGRDLTDRHLTNVSLSYAMKWRPPDGMYENRRSKSGSPWAATHTQMISARVRTSRASVVAEMTVTATLQPRAGEDGSSTQELVETPSPIGQVTPVPWSGHKLFGFVAGEGTTEANVSRRTRRRGRSKTVTPEVS